MKLISRICIYLWIFVAILLSLSFLSEDDPSLEVLDKNTSQETKQMRLYFQGTENNFIIFYDYFNNIIYLQYRKDKWDYSKDKIISRLQEGIVYLVSFKYKGKSTQKVDTRKIRISDILKSKEYNPLVDNTNKSIRNKDNLYIGELIEVKSSLLDYNLRY